MLATKLVDQPVKIGEGFVLKPFANSLILCRIGGNPEFRQSAARTLVIDEIALDTAHQKVHISPVAAMEFPQLAVETFHMSSQVHANIDFSAARERYISERHELGPAYR